MAWTDLTFSFGSLLTSSKMTQLYDNITATANGDSGAPSVQTAAYASESVDQAAIDNNAVGQGELKTGSGSISTTTSLETVLPGGGYGFWPEIQITSGSTLGVLKLETATIEAYAPTVTIEETGSGSMQAQQTYLQASPPYNLGNGDIPLFIYVLINNSTGKAEGAYIAEDPPWAYNGPKRINPKKCFTLNKKRYLKRTKRPWSHAEALGSRAKFIENMAAVYNPTIEVVEITHALKNAGVSDIPHPFSSHNPATHTVVLLDPCSSLCDNLHTLTQESNEGMSEISELLYAERIKFDNTPINGLITPPGVMGVKMRLA